MLACSPQAPAQNAPVDSAAQDPRAQTGLREVPLTIRSKNKLHHFTVQIAATPDQQEKGLMFRRSLGADQGMIFPYEPPQEVAFWMKNTLIPLDIIYIRSDGTIVRITKAEAMDLTPRGIRKHLDLNKPIYARTSSYGHFGRTPDKDGGFSWEKTDLADALKRAV